MAVVWMEEATAVGMAVVVRALVGEGGGAGGGGHMAAARVARVSRG